MIGKVSEELKQQWTEDLIRRSSQELASMSDFTLSVDLAEAFVRSLLKTYNEIQNE